MIFHMIDVTSKDLLGQNEEKGGKWIGWIRPSVGCYKLNTDGSVKNQSATGGGVIRDHEGHLIATSLSAAERQKLIDLLRELRDVFAWSYRDMPGLDTAQTWWSTACLLKQNENASLFFCFDKLAQVTVGLHSSLLHSPLASPL